MNRLHVYRALRRLIGPARAFRLAFREGTA